jgi:hypothetical protein
MQNGGRLSADQVRNLERMVGEDPADQAAVMAFIGHFYCADELFEIPPSIYRQICQRPGAFVEAARKFAAPELPW